MGKIKRGGYLFVAWKGDHAPRHVHILKNGKVIAKWDLENDSLIEGSINKRMLKALRSLQKEGSL